MVGADDSPACVLFFRGRLALAADLIATIVYLAGTILFYCLSKKPERRPD